MDDAGPDDPLGTVGAGEGLLAVRAPSAQPTPGDELSWFIIPIGGHLDPDLDIDQLYTWPIAYQP
jgi:hypothetical protein